MNVSQTSRVARASSRAADGSRVFAALAQGARNARWAMAALGRNLADSANRGDQWLASSGRPLEIPDVAPVLQTSRLSRAVAVLWSRMEAAAAESMIRRGTVAVRAAIGQTDLETRIGLVGSLVMVAMAVHVALLFLAERYPFPNPAAVALPLCLMGLALVSVAMRRGLAAAWRDRGGSR